jgi:hypothetical protein
MKSVTQIASVALTLAIALGLAGTGALRGQDAVTASPSVVPPLIKFNGVMVSLGAQNRTSESASGGLITATFSLYEFQEGGNPLWSETQKVQLDEQGHYVVLLGATSPAGVPLDLFASGKALWLGVQPQVSGAGELPRVLLAPVPYALKASDSDTLGGKPASAFALAGAPTVVGVVGTAASTNPALLSTGKAASVEPLAGCSTITTSTTTTANSVPKFTAACAVGNSLIRDNGTGVAVGGTATPAALFDVQFNSAATTGTVQAQRVLSTLNPTTASAVNFYGAFANTQTASANTQSFTGNNYASVSEMDHYGKGTLGSAAAVGGLTLNQGTGTISTAYGLYSIAANLSTGKISNAYGLYAAAANLGTGTITDGYGLYVSSPLNGGTFSNYTGVYIGTPSAITGAYGLYSAGGKNYFAGNVGIGTTTPAATLEVNGTTKFDGLVTFKSGQTFPGAGGGTITGISTTSPLTGSGTSGSVALGLNTTALNTTLNSTYAQLEAANTFTQGQTIHGVTTITALNNLGTALSVDNTAVGANTAITATLTSAYSVAIYGSAAGGGWGLEGLAQQSYPGSIGVMGSLSNSNGYSSTFSLLNTDADDTAGVWADGPNGQTAALFATADTPYAAYFENDSSSNSTLYVHNRSTGGLGDVIRGNAPVLRVEGSEGVCGINQTGSLACTGQLKAVVTTQNGAHQVETYSVQSAENWLEDYGSGRLLEGSVTINLDPAFTDTVNTGVDFHVFLTPGGDCKGLYVTNKTATSFEVHELGGGAASIPFDYKIVAKRRGHENERLVDVTARMKLEAAANHPKPQTGPRRPPRSMLPGNRPASPAVVKR